jgi:hypothetical protein
MPSREEILEVAGGDEAKANMLAGAAQHVAETREKNAGMRGFIDAQRQADELSLAYYTLRGDKPVVYEPDSDEMAEDRRAVERIAADRHLYGGFGR